MNIVYLVYFVSTVDDYSFLIICKDRNDLIRKSCVSIIQSLFDRTVQGNSYNRLILFLLSIIL